ncbi:MAG: GAF domain-containing protein [bacterium]|nr:GAF domain-containing protein [bacterium]
MTTTRTKLTEPMRPEEMQRRKVVDQTALFEVSQAFLRQADVESTLENISRLAVERFGLKMAWVGLVVPGQVEVRPASACGFEEGYLASIRVTCDDSPTGRGPTGTAIRTAQAVAMNRIDSEPAFAPWRAAALARGYRSSAALPLLDDQEVLGALNVYSAEPEHFTPNRIQVLRSFANLAAIALGEARLLEQVQRRTAELEATLVELREAQGALTMTSELEPDRVFQTLAELARELVDATYAAVTRPPEAPREALRFYTAGMTEAERAALGEPPRGRGVLSCLPDEIGPVRLADVRQHPRFTGFPPRHPVMTSYLSVPLVSRDRVLGGLHLADKISAAAFSEEDQQVIETLAAQAAVAIENARLFEQTRQDAATKAILLREVNHRVTNNLAAISGLLRREQHRSGIDDQAAFQAVMKNLRSRVNGMATLHHLLSSSEWSPLPLSKLVERVVNSALQMLPADQHVTVKVTPSAVRVAPKYANDLALAINELTTNSVKYAWPARRSGQIAVRIDRQEDTVQLEFRDDGPGFPEEVLRLERHSIGWELIQAAVDRGLRGEVTLHNDRGAVTTIRFPLPPEGELGSQDALG